MGLLLAAIGRRAEGSKSEALSGWRVLLRRICRQFSYQGRFKVRYNNSNAEGQFCRSDVCDVLHVTFRVVSRRISD